jgi:hypothetical protein
MKIDCGPVFIENATCKKCGGKWIRLHDETAEGCRRCRGRFLPLDEIWKEIK